MREFKNLTPEDISPREVQRILRYQREKENEKEGRKTRKEEARDYLDKLTDSYDLDDRMRNLFWGFASSDVVLSYIPSEKKIRRKMDHLDDVIDTYVISRPEHELTWDEWLAIDQFKEWYEFRLLRAYQGHERKMMTAETRISKEFVEGPREGESRSFAGRFKRGLRSAFGKREREESEKSVMEGPPI